MKYLEKLKEEKFLEFRKKSLNTIQKVYIEEIKLDKAYGYTENYLKVELEAENHKVMDVIDVKIVSVYDDLLKGETV